MKSQRFVTFVWAASIVLLMSPWTVMSRAQGQETITALAAVTTATGSSTSAPVTFVVERFSTDAERESLVTAVKTGGTSAARETLAKRGNVGWVQLGTTRTPVKYAYARSTASGRLITLITAEPILFTGGNQTAAKPKQGYDLGLALLDVNASGSGQGELAPAAKVHIDAQEAIVTEDSGPDIVRLTNIARK